MKRSDSNLTGVATNVVASGCRESCPWHSSMLTAPIARNEYIGDKQSREIAPYGKHTKCGSFSSQDIDAASRDKLFVRNYCEPQRQEKVSCCRARSQILALSHSNRTLPDDRIMIADQVPQVKLDI